MKEQYSRTSGLMVLKTDKAILFDPMSNEKGEPEKTFWIPLSLIHGGDAFRIERQPADSVIDFRVLTWKAKELGI